MLKGVVMSKISKVLKYIQTHKKGITSMQAIEMFKATRLSAIIFELRKRYKITSISEQGITEDGYTYTYARYVYQGEIYK